MKGGMDESNKLWGPHYDQPSYRFVNVSRLAHGDDILRLARQKQAEPGRMRVTVLRLLSQWI